MTHPIPLPPTIILLGTDASGKNHVARLWAKRIREAGFPLEIREGSLCGKSAEQEDHGDKGALALFAERCFITVFPILRPLVYPGMWLLLRWDAWRFRSGSDKLLVVSLSALRVLVFHLGQHKGYPNHQLPGYLERALRNVQQCTNAVVIVLDVDDETRQQRIRQRLAQGSIDPFDQFMADDSERSERIEACLVDLAKRYYGAYLLENNDLGDDALWEALLEACSGHKQAGLKT